MVGFGLAAMIFTFIARAYDRDVDYYVPAAEVERIERALPATARRQLIMTTSLKLRADAAPGIHAPGHASDAHGHDAPTVTTVDDHVVQSAPRWASGST
jgi:hypothetical protein